MRTLRSAAQLHGAASSPCPCHRPPPMRSWGGWQPTAQSVAGRSVAAGRGAPPDPRLHRRQPRRSRSCPRSARRWPHVAGRTRAVRGRPGGRRVASVVADGQAWPGSGWAQASVGRGRPVLPASVGDALALERARRPSRPHLTVARRAPPGLPAALSRPFRDARARLAGCTELVLYRSHLGPPRLRYEAIGRLPLRRATCRGAAARAEIQRPQPAARGRPDVQADEVRALRGSHPASLVQHRGGPAGAAGTGPPSWHRPAHRPGRPGAALPDGPHRARS